MPNLPGVYCWINIPPLPPPEPRCVLVVWLRGWVLGYLPGTRSECEATWAEVKAEFGDEATHEIRECPHA